VVADSSIEIPMPKREDIEDALDRLTGAEPDEYN
jgi:hypothetical protein